MRTFCTFQYAHCISSLRRRPLETMDEPSLMLPVTWLASHLLINKHRRALSSPGHSTKNEPASTIVPTGPTVCAVCRPICNTGWTSCTRRSDLHRGQEARGLDMVRRAAVQDAHIHTMTLPTSRGWRVNVNHASGSSLRPTRLDQTGRENAGAHRRMLVHVVFDWFLYLC